MKPPPFLLGAALLFWGWQSGLLIVGAVMAVVLESARFVKARWDFSDEDFSRIFTLCSLLLLGALLFAFANNDGVTSFAGFFQDPNPQTQSRAGSSGARTAYAVFRWAPMIFLPFIAAQLFSTRETVPWKAISFLVRRRFKKAQQLGQPAPPVRSVNVGFPYFVVTLLGAAAHPTEGKMYFWGLSALMAWALWSLRSKRFALMAWAATMACAICLGYFGQRGLGEAVRLLENFQPQWLSYFMRQRFNPLESETAIGRIGEVKTSKKIVIRLQPKNGSPVPTYLREASYRAFSRQRWYAGIGEAEFEFVNESPPSSLVWPLLSTKTNNTAVNIGCSLPGGRGLLPLPTGSSRVEKLNIIELKKSPLGAVLARGPGFAIFDAYFGPGETIDSPPGTNDVENIPRNRDTGTGNVSARELPAIQQVIADLQLESKSREEQLNAIRGFFADQFTYSTWQRPQNLATNETPLGRFLLQTRSGHCEYFATATVLLLRQLKIPARYAVGYAVHETSGSGYVVRMSDAHAWTLVWDEASRTWLDFDTTPASWIDVESKLSGWQWISDAWSRITFEFGKFRSGQSRWRQYLLWAIVPGLGFLIYQIVFRRRSRQRQNKSQAAAPRTDWPGLDSEFYMLEAKLAERGVPREPGEALADWLERVAREPALAQARAPLRELLRLHYRYRFDPAGLNTSEREALKSEAGRCLKHLIPAGQG